MIALREEKLMEMKSQLDKTIQGTSEFYPPGESDLVPSLLLAKVSRTLLQSFRYLFDSSDTHLATVYPFDTRPRSKSLKRNPSTR